MWDLDVVRLGYVANLGVATFLAAAAYVVATRLRIPGHLILATYLSLVAANYALDALGNLVLLLGGPGNRFRDAAYVAGALDPPMLSLFALAFAGWHVSRLTRALLLVPSILLVAQAIRVLLLGEPRLPAELYSALIPVLAGHYVLALVVLAHAHHRARTPEERDLRATFVMIFAVIILPRMPLLFADARLVFGVGRAEVQTILMLEGTLAVLVLVAALAFMGTAPMEARASTRRVIRTTTALVAVVAGLWLLRLAPGFSQAAFALLYSSRWIVFAGVLSLDATRQRILGLPASISRTARGCFTGLLAFLVLVEITALLSGVPGANLTSAFLGGLAFTAVVVVAGVLLGRRRMAEEETRVLSRRIYRAHLELGAPQRRLEELRKELGLDDADAREEERLLRMSHAMEDSAFDHPEPGRTFAGRYSVEHLQGSGSFGLVYDARDTITGRRVLLKELRDHWRATPEAVARLRREAEIALRIKHPSLVQLLAIEKAAKGHVLVLKRVEGETLAQRRSKGPLPPATVGALARDILGALAALHDAGVFHRDVKPDNIVLRPDGRAVLLDLGSASEVASTSTRLKGETHPGTPMYMSPEQRRGDRLDATSDLYALALVLKEALGTDRPAGWSAVLERALSEDPQARWPDARAFAAALPL